MMLSILSTKARDFWDRISPRERRLVVIAAIATPITIALWLALAIHDGFAAMESRNDKARKALRILADMRTRGGVHTPADDVLKQMGTESIALDVYLTKAATKAKFELKSTITPRTPQTKNGFVTSTSSLTLNKITIDQLKDFLMEIETASKYVMVTHIDLRRDFRDKDKLTVNLEVSAYSKESTAKVEGGSREANGGG